MQRKTFVIDRNPLDPNPLLTDESFISDLLDDIITTRLSEETYKPVLLKLGTSVDRGQVEYLIDYCRLSGIDGILIESDSLEKARRMLSGIVKKTSGRFPVVVSAPFTSIEEASDALGKGASLLMLHPFKGSPIPRPKGILRGLEAEYLSKQNPQGK